MGVSLPNKKSKASCLNESPTPFSVSKLKSHSFLKSTLCRCFVQDCRLQMSDPCLGFLHSLLTIPKMTFEAIAESAIPCLYE